MNSTENEFMHVPASELASKSGLELVRLLEENQQAIDRLIQSREWLESVVAYKYVYRASQLRAELEQSFGEVVFEDDGVQVVVDLPREVVWDQKKLRAIAECIRAQGEDPGEFLDIQYHVPEERFDYWPETIQRAFEAAFTIKPGSPTYRLVALGREVAA